LKNKAARLALAALLAAAAALPVRAELLQLERLRRPAPRFTLKLDIFRGGADMGAPAVAAEPTPAQAEVLQRSIAEEIAQSISYEGSIMKNARTLALLNVSGEFFTVGEGEAILDKIRILKITRQVVTIEYDGQPYEIRIKGDQNG
jgi:hypothetical protein